MHKKGIIVGGMAGVLVLIGAILAGSNASATVTCGNPNSAGVSTCTDSTTGAITYKSSSSATASVTVSSACSFSTTRAAGYDNEKGYTDTLANNASTEITGSTFTTLCNDAGGYAIYAVGYSNNTLGNTDLIFNNTPSSTNNIHTDGSGSNWGMTMSATVPNKPVIESGFSDPNNPHTIPSTYTKVASYNTVATEISNNEQVGQSITAHYYAHASATQPAGTYTGAVKYTMVHPGTMPTPIKLIDDLEYMQDFATLTSAEKTSVLNSMGMETTYTLKDKRDEQEYTIAKLKDNKVWMTKNLNLAGGTTLTSDKTDFVNGYTIPTNQGWQANGTLPASAVKNSDNNNLTDSSQFSTNNYAYVYNSGNTTGCGASGQNIPCYSYYSWDVATLGSGRSISTDNTDAPYSICPKGWKLPSTYNGSGTAAEATDSRALMIALGGSNSIQIYNSSTSPTGAAMYNAIKAGTAPNFLLAGYYSSGSFNAYYGGSSGYYWSSTSYSNSNRARDLYFYSSVVNSADNYTRRVGFSVRCLVAE